MRLTLVSATSTWTVWRIYGANGEYVIARGRCDHEILRQGADGWLVWREGRLHVTDVETGETEELPMPGRPANRRF